MSLDKIAQLVDNNLVKTENPPTVKASIRWQRRVFFDSEKDNIRLKLQLSGEVLYAYSTFIEAVTVRSCGDPWTSMLSNILAMKKTPMNVER